MTHDLLEDIEIANVPVASNGHHKAFRLVCENCGEEFESNRKQVPGKRAWCSKPDCKRAAGAMRARDLRERRSKIQP